MSHRKTGGGGGGGSALSALGAVHDLRIVFHGIDKVSYVSDSILSKVRALGGGIAALGGAGLLVTNLGEQFGFLSKQQALSVDKTFALIVASGGLISVFARLIPVLQSLSIAQNIANAARAVALALSGPVGWAILAGAVAAIAGFVAYEAGAIPGLKPGGAKTGQFGLNTMVSGPTLFLAGEAGPERVTITPAGRSGAEGAGIMANITINGTGDPTSVARAVKRELELLIERERIRRS